MAFQDRWYQIEAVDATISLMQENPLAHPLIVMPTGSGKSPTMCRFVDRHLSMKPTDRILVLSHVAEIVEQDHRALEKYFEVGIGLYAAGLDSKTIKKITVAQIQSAYHRPELFRDFNIVLIDEAHRIPVSGEGMYRTFLNALEATYIGLTATHFRLGHGYIHKGEGALFTDIAYDLSEFEAFNRLVAEGFLSRLVTKNTIEKLDATGVKKTGGDFNVKALSEKFDRDEITRAAIDETIIFGKNFKKWLLFAIDIKHAENIAKELNERGIPSACIHSKLKKRERKRILKAFHDGVYRAIVNVDVLTTGFDEPGIDLIVILRPTDSPSLHVQIIGRGLRVIYADGFDLDTIEGRLAAIESGPKKVCLVLDFAGNTDRLGPINDVKVKEKGKKGSGEPITKECPECQVVHHPSVRICDNCGHEFVFQEKIITEASASAVVKEAPVEIRSWLDVDEIKYSIHQKPGSPSSLRVTYKTGFMSFSEWVVYDHPNERARRRARHWVRFRWLGYKDNIPQNVDELYANTDLLMRPRRILVDNSSKFPAIEDYIFGGG